MKKAHSRSTAQAKNSASTGIARNCNFLWCGVIRAMRCNPCFIAYCPKTMMQGINYSEKNSNNANLSDDRLLQRAAAVAA